MAAKKQNKGLGRGLSALLSETPKNAPAKTDTASAEPAAAPAADRMVPIEHVAPNPDQPRVIFNAEKLAELAASIKDRGILQPILVRSKAGPKGAKYQIIAGERRWRAAQEAKLDKIPVIIRELSDQETQEAALIENVQRADLSAMEEARGYRGLIDKFGYTQKEVADIIGKSRPHIANTLRLLELPAKLQAIVDKGEISAGHARALIGLENAEELAKLIVSEGLTVREAEARAQNLKGKPKSATKNKAVATLEKDADTKALERDLGQALGLKVSISFKGEDKGGSVEIAYKTLEQLDGLIAKLRH